MSKLILVSVLFAVFDIYSCNVVISPIEGGLQFSLVHNEVVRLRGQLGHLPKALQPPVSCGEECLQFSDYATMRILERDGDCETIEWSSDIARELRDCFLVENNWYGGGETNRQYWPIERENRPEAPFVTGDSYSAPDTDYGGVSENYWLVSSGVGLYVPEDIPLFVSTNTTKANHFCISAKHGYPYKKRETLKLQYTLCAANNLKVAHNLVHEKFFSKPTSQPDTGMLLRPFWSTWAEYKEHVNESVVVGYAQEVVQEGFQYSSHIEIDDHWETCYGEAVFDPVKFPDVSRMVNSIKAMGFKVTLWIHPFININCPSFAYALNQNYLVKTDKNKPGITSWWQGRNSGILDFTNAEAVEWWVGRLEKLRTDHGIDSFKFDAGETNWLPHSSLLNGDLNLQPNLYSTVFAQALSEFGSLIEVRTVKKTQDKGIFVRMLDKDSKWGYDNGLKSLIPTLLHMGLQGYPFVLPDMIGGNGYQGVRPSKELYIRWMQANAFMPAVQMSIVPWGYDQQVIDITKQVLEVRKQFESDIMAAAGQSLVDGSPINRPLWWHDPEDPETYNIDNEYLLGDRILVAPVLEEGANTRSIYLPVGNWLGMNNVTYTGPQLLANFPADITVLPYFIKL